METSNKKTNQDGENTKTTVRYGQGYDQGAGGNEGEPFDPFAKTSRVARTPPRPRVDSCPELKIPLVKTSMLASERDKRKRTELKCPSSSEMEISEVRGKPDEEVFVVEGSPSPKSSRKSKKKKNIGFFSSNIAGVQIGETEDESAMTNGLIQLMQQLENTAGDLTYQISKHVNTKVEVKKLAREIDMMSQSLSRKLHKYCKFVARKLLRSSDNERQMSPSVTPSQEVKATKEAASQTDPSLRKQRRRDEEEERVTEAESDADVLEAVKLQWPEEWYKATKIKMGNPWNSLGEEDFAILLLDSQASMEGGISRLLRDRFPEVEKIEGSGSLRVISSVQLGEEDPVIRLRHVHKVALNAVTEADILNALRTLKSLALQGSGGVAIPIPTGADEAQFRKLVDLVFRREGIRALIHTPQRKGGKSGIQPMPRLPAGDTRRERRERGTEVLLVKQGQRSYGDMVKGLKVMAGENEKLKTLKQVRKTQDGRLLIAFKKGDSEAMEAVRSQLKESWEGVEVSGGSKRDTAKCTLHIKGLDDAVEDVEIREAICGVAPALQGDAVEIGPRRPMYGGNWAVTVRVAGADLGELRNRKKIRIGFNECTVEERLDVTKCFRCWEFGHLARNCKGPDRRSLCSGCGLEGHLAAQYKNEVYCVLCEKKGHRGGSGSCPKFKRALSEKRASSVKEREPLSPHDE